MSVGAAGTSAWHECPRRMLVDPGVFVGAVSLQIDLEFLPGALQFVLFPASLESEVEVASETRTELRFHVAEAEQHAAEMREVTYGAAGLERTQEGDRAEDHDHVFGFDREQETEEHGLIREEHSEGEQKSVDGAGGSEI